MFLTGSRIKNCWPAGKQRLVAAAVYLGRFLKRHWKGTLLLAFATLVFFWPMVTRIGTYSEGGDAMFNAWTLARDQHCIMRDHCPHYADGNIFFPHKNSMLYSETQLSAGLLTLPLSWINSNPIFSYNVWTILSFFFAGWFMYLLVKRLSRGHELVSVLAGLAFEFAPIKMASVTHLQNLSIFYLPLAVLLAIKFLDTALKRYLALLFVALTLLFYASWYQMVFALIALGIMLVLMPLLRLVPWKKALLIAGVVGAAAITTAPLALQYVHFSKQNNATFSIGEQASFSASVADYFVPHAWTIVGRLYRAVVPHAMHNNSFNYDSFSYTGVVLYVLAAVLLVVGGRWCWQEFRRRKTKKGAERASAFKYVIVFASIAAVGFVISLGPFVQLAGSYMYTHIKMDGLALVIPAPWLLVDKLLPQLEFIRAIGRAAILVLFGLCCVLAYLPFYLRSSNLSKRRQTGIMAAVTVLMVVELLPMSQVFMRPYAYEYNQNVPQVYQYIKAHKEIDDIIVLRSIPEYKDTPIPVAAPQDVLWAGYTNRDTYNGYSGYKPPEYDKQYLDFAMLDASDVPKMRQLGLRYVLIDKLLSQQKPQLITTAAQLFPHKIYEDGRYALYQMPLR